MIIYHFCNDTFGIPFQPVSAAFAKARKVHIVRVLSVKRDPPWFLRVVRHPAGRALRRAKRIIRGAPSHGEDLPTLQVTNVNDPDFYSRIKPGDVAVITGFNQIFQAPIIERFASFVNLHPSILPMYRGPVPTYWQIRNGEKLTGFTFHNVTPKIDSGEPIYQDVVSVEGETDVLGLALKVGNAAVPVFLKYLDHLVSGEPWVPRYVDARKVYRMHQNYAPFPKVEERRHVRR